MKRPNRVRFGGRRRREEHQKKHKLHRNRLRLMRKVSYRIDNALLIDGIIELLFGVDLAGNRDLVGTILEHSTLRQGLNGDRTSAAARWAQGDLERFIHIV